MVRPVEWEQSESFGSQAAVPFTVTCQNIQCTAVGNDTLTIHSQAISLAMMPSMIPNREKSLPP